MKRAPLETRRHFERRVAERERFLADIIITAVEGGIGYWATVLSYKHATPSETCAVVVENDVYEEVAAASFRRGAEPTTFYPEHYRENGIEVDADEIAKAIDWMLEYKVQIRGDLRAEITHAANTNDAGMIDADGADALFQIAALGEITYG